MPDLLEFTTDVAVEAGELLSRYYASSSLHVTQKSDHTVVTEADMAADRQIISAIRTQFPQDGIISEESFFQVSDTKSPIWIIDPLDGTTNFSLGVPIWGVSIARIESGFPVLGVLYFPLLQELYTCMRGSGAFLNHEPINTKTPDPTQPMSFFSCCSRSFRYYNISIPFKPRILGSAAYTFCMVARGAALLGMDAASKIWDLAAGWLLVEEANGVIAELNGDAPFPVIPDKDYHHVNYPLLAAASQDVLCFGLNKIQRK